MIQAVKDLRYGFYLQNRITLNFDFGKEDG